MKVGSLFSGCGGTALGFHRAGFDHLWFVEVNKYAAATLRKNFPEATVYGDITKVDFRTVPRVDVLEGGFPCQDISNAGKRAGIKGRHSSLWKDFARAIRELRPRFVSIENVSALTRRGLDVVLGDLAAIGYDAEWHCIPASAVGAPHRRDRIFILAYPNGCGWVHGQSGEYADQGGEPSLAYSGESGEDVADTFSKRCGSERHSRGEWPLYQESERDGLPKDCEPEAREFRSCSDCRCSSSNDGRGCEEYFREDFERSSKIGWWSSEPGVGRVAYGVPSRVDRIKCLGNAVVPQNAEVIAKAIKEVKQ